MFPTYTNILRVYCFSGITDTTKREKYSWKIRSNRIDVFPLFKESNSESSLGAALIPTYQCVMNNKQIEIKEYSILFSIVVDALLRVGGRREHDKHSLASQ